MNLSKIFFIFIILLNSCAEYSVKNNRPEKKYYNSSGFALVYDINYYKQKLINKKINNDENHIMHRSLKKNTTVKKKF